MEGFPSWLQRFTHCVFSIIPFGCYTLVFYHVIKDFMSNKTFYMELHLQGTVGTITANGNLRLLILTVFANLIARFLKDILEKHTSEEILGVLQREHSGNHCK